MELTELTADTKLSKSVSIEEKYVSNAKFLHHSHTKVGLNDQPSVDIFFNGEMHKIPPRKFFDDKWMPKEIRNEDMMEKVPLFGEKNRVFDPNRQLTAGTFLNFDPEDFFGDDDTEDEESNERVLRRIFCVTGESSGFLNLSDLSTREITIRFGSHGEEVEKVVSLHNGQIISLSENYVRFWKCVPDRSRHKILVLGTHILKINGCGSINSILPTEVLPESSIVDNKEDIRNERFISNFLVGTSHGKVFDVELPPLPTKVPSDGGKKSGGKPTEYDILKSNRVQRILYHGDRDNYGGLHLAFNIRKSSIEGMEYCFGGQYIVIKSLRNVYLFRRSEELEDEDEGEGDDDDDDDETKPVKQQPKEKPAVGGGKANFEKVGLVNLRSDFEGFDFFCSHPDILYFVGTEIPNEDVTNEITFKEFHYDEEEGKFTVQHYLTGNHEISSEIETSVKGRVVNPSKVAFSKDMFYVFCGCDNTTSFFKFEVIPKKVRDVYEKVVEIDEKRKELQEKYHEKVSKMVKKFKQKIKRMDDELVDVEDSEEEEEEEEEMEDEEEEEEVGKKMMKDEEDEIKKEKMVDED